MIESDLVPSVGGAPRRADFVRRRLLVIDAFLDLVLAGDPSPETEAVAERAGVSRASVFRYFSTLEELRTEAMGRVFERFLELFELGDPSPGSSEARIARFIESRLRFHETLHPLALLQRRHAGDSSDAAALVDMSRNLLADQVRSYFVHELADLTDDERDGVVIDIAVLTSIESWHQFHHSHRRTSAQIRRAWIAALRALLSGTPSTASGEPT